MILLLKGSDLFVDEAARIARLIGMSGFVIGLTLVSLGTSLPELATAITSSLLGQSSIVLGNIIGSNIANLSLILGIAALLTTIVLRREAFVKDCWFLLGIFALFYILALDRVISSIEGILFLIIFVVYLYLLLHRKPLSGEKTLEKFVKTVIKTTNGKCNLKNYDECISKGINYKVYNHLLKQGVDVKGDFKKKLLSDVYKKSLYGIVGLIAVLVGAKYLVTSAITLASYLGISPHVVAITAIAIGTSLPELFVSIASAQKGMGSILVGNLIGSGIANILLVGGISAMITPLLITQLDLYFYIPFMIFTGFVFLQFIRSKWISKVMEGALLIFFYSIFIFFVILLQGL